MVYIRRKTLVELKINFNNNFSTALSSTWLGNAKNAASFKPLWLWVPYEIKKINYA